MHKYDVWLASFNYLFNMSIVNLMICCRLEKICKEVTCIFCLMTTKVYVPETFLICSHILLCICIECDSFKSFLLIVNRNREK